MWIDLSSECGIDFSDIAEGRASESDTTADIMDLGTVLRSCSRSKVHNLRSEIAKINQSLPSMGRISSFRRPRQSSPSLQTFESAGQYDTGVSGYVRWPTSTARSGSAEERAAYFNQLQVTTLQEARDPPPEDKQASTLLQLMTIRAHHNRILRRYSIGTALGLRTRSGQLTARPAIIVFVARKVHEQWLLEAQKLPTTLHGPEGYYCDVDVVEFAQYGTSNVAPREQVYNEAVEGLRGRDSDIGPGSQVASEEMYGTFSAVVRSRSDKRLPGFLTNRHVAVDFDQPKQKMYHPLPPSLGPGMYLGSVERATSFASDHAWYGVFAGQNPETFVRADGAFIPFWNNFDIRKVTTTIKGVGNMGKLYRIDLNDKISTIVGRRVSKLGSSSGLTKGTIMAYAVEYNDDKGVCYFTDFLILGEDGQPFDIEGDSGSLIVLDSTESELARPIGIIWGGTANRGRLKLRNGKGPENWTSGVDIGRLLDLLELDLITTMEELHVAVNEREQSSPSNLRQGGEAADEEASCHLSKVDGQQGSGGGMPGDSPPKDSEEKTVQQSLFQPDALLVDRPTKRHRTDG